MPAPTHAMPRCSRTPCHTSHAPPISVVAAGRWVHDNGRVRPRGTSPRFVGRAGELALFDELLGEARAGEPVTVFVCGEAGARQARLVSGPEGGAVGRESPDPGQFEVSAQLRLFEEMLDGLERAAAPGGLLVVIEDLHWADPSSRGLFEFLSRSLRGAAVVLVGTVRTDEPDDAGFLAWLAEVQRGPRAIRMDLEPFGREELADLVEGVLGRPPSPELVGRVYERSGGNALLAEELLAAGEGGVLVPTTVRGLVLARMAGMSAPARGPPPVGGGGGGGGGY